jgi:hypothetical protein
MQPAGFGYQQQMLAGIRPGGAQMPNYFVPVVPRQGQQGQRAGGRRTGGAPPQQQQQQQPQQQVGCMSLKLKYGFCECIISYGYALTWTMALCVL